MSGDAGNNLDALLDDALEGFGAVRQPPEGSEAAPASSSAVTAGSSTGTAPAFDPLPARRPAKGRRATAGQPLPRAGGGAEAEGGEALAAGLSKLLAELANVPPEDEDAGPAPGGEAGAEPESELAATMRALAQHGLGPQEAGGAPAGLGGLGLEGGNADELLRSLLGEVGGGGGAGEGSGPQMASLVDHVMAQLLSKEVLYQPMKEIGERYPAWLEEHRAALSSGDLERYTRQYDYIQRITGLYESDPGNLERLVGLLQEMQQCGQPPQEIVDELAPGMAFGGGEALPGIGGGSGLPADLGECCLQ